MKAQLRFTLLLGFCAASGVLFWLYPEREKVSPVVVTIEPEFAEEMQVQKSKQPLVAAEPRDVVYRLCGIIGDGSTATLMDAAHSLPEDLNAEEYEMILNHVLLAAQPDGMYYRAWHAVFNDTLNALVGGQKTRIEALPNHLREILKDNTRHVVIRDYALQHLLSYAEFRMNPSERLSLLDALWPEVHAGGHSLPGTYLLALFHTPDRNGWPSENLTAERSWELLQDEKTHILSSITALQICGQLGYEPALPLALEIASDSKAHMTLRTAAIATIGNLGGAEEQGYLRDLGTRVPKRLQVAVSAALSTLSKHGKKI